MSRSSPWRMVLAASAGNMLEFYDIVVFGFFTAQIGAAFFPDLDPEATRLHVWGLFGASYIARPIGALALGNFADRAGRRASLTVSIVLMTLGTAILAFMPRYGTIGLVAPAGVIIARLLQGFSAGGEFGGATAFMMEHAQDDQRGFFASFQFISQAVSNMTAALMALLVVGLLPPADLSAWGFRLPFMVGLLIGPVGLYLRRGVDETPAFLASAPKRVPWRELTARDLNRILGASCMVALGTVGTYLNIYLPDFAHAHLHLRPQAGLWINLATSTLALITTPLVAIWSDRRRRWQVSAICAVAMLLLAIPLMEWTASAPSFGTLFGAIAVLTMLRAAYSAPLPALFAELFDVRVRALGMSLGYTLGVAIFGGFTPYVCSQLVTATGHVAAPGYVVAAAAGLSLWALWAWGKSVARA